MKSKQAHECFSNHLNELTQEQTILKTKETCILGTCMSEGTQTQHGVSSMPDWCNVFTLTSYINAAGGMFPISFNERWRLVLAAFRNLDQQHNKYPEELSIYQFISLYIYHCIYIIDHCRINAVTQGPQCEKSVPSGCCSFQTHHVVINIVLCRPSH